MAFLCLCIPAAAASLPPLPRTPAAAASQAANAAMSALQASKDPLRLQIQLYGETVEESGPLPVLSLCTRLVEVLSAHERWNQIHFYFDGARALQAWQQQSPAAAEMTRCDSLDTVEECVPLPDDALLVVVAPCNHVSGRIAPQSTKLLSVQKLLYGAKHVPIILVNPDLEAHILLRKVGRSVPPMFLSDFEDAFFLAEAQAYVGGVTAVRRVYGSTWEVYRVATVEKAATAAERGRGRGRRAVAGSRKDEGEDAAEAALERTTLAQCCEGKPRSADLLAAYAKRRRARAGIMSRKKEVPGRPAEAWAAEDGWQP